MIQFSKDHTNWSNEYSEGCTVCKYNDGKRNYYLEITIKPMTYIKLEDALKYVQSKIRAYDPADDFSQAYNLEDEILLGINSLPSIEIDESVKQEIEKMSDKQYLAYIQSIDKLLNKLHK